MKTKSKVIDARISELAEIESQIEKLRRQAEEIKDEIKQFMGAEEELITENYVVKWINVESNRFDTKLFKEDHPKLYESYRMPSYSRRFSFK